MRIEILPSAKERLLEIWSYTAAHWGSAQADKYLRELERAMQDAATQPGRWRKIRGGRFPLIRFIRHAEHYIFFREPPYGCIGVISVLHAAMDVPSRLEEDAK